LGLIYC